MLVLFHCISKLAGQNDLSERPSVRIKSDEPSREGEGVASETRRRFSPLQAVYRNELTTSPILVRIG